MPSGPRIYSRLVILQKSVFSSTPDNGGSHIQKKDTNYKLSDKIMDDYFKNTKVCKNANVQLLSDWIDTKLKDCFTLSDHGVINMSGTYQWQKWMFVIQHHHLTMESSYNGLDNKASKTTTTKIC